MSSEERLGIFFWGFPTCVKLESRLILRTTPPGQRPSRAGDCGEELTAPSFQLEDYGMRMTDVTVQLIQSEHWKARNSTGGSRWRAFTSDGGDAAALRF